MKSKIEITEAEFQTDVALRAVHGFNYITGIVVCDWDDEDEGSEEFYRVEVRHPIDSSDWFKHGYELARKFETLQFPTRETAVESIRADLESLEFAK